jgi:hypothetical protein
MPSLQIVVALFTTLALPPGLADTPVASDPVFNALTVDGALVSGRIRQIGPKGEITLVTVEGPERVLPLETLVKLSRDAVNPSLSPEASVVLFPNGDRLYRTSIGAASETALEVQSYTLGNVAVPLESMLGLVLALPTDSDALDGLVQRVRSERRSSEILWLANGDRLTGGFLGLTDKTIEFQPGKEPIKLDRQGVVALGFDPSLVVYPKP